MNHITNANKQGWDKLAEIQTKTYRIDRLLSGEPLLNDLIRSEVGDVLVHPLCHIGTDTFSWAPLGAKVTEIDISPKSLHYARLLAARMGIEAEFIESDIMDVIDNVNRKFDVAFASTGALCWIPDIERFARTVRHLLVDGGFFYIHDGHPFRSVMVDEEDEIPPDRIVGDYFWDRAWHYNGLGDYTDLSFLAPTESYEWNW